MRVLWWFVFVLIASYELWRVWGDIATHDHPWFYGLLRVLVIAVVISLYPMARNYDQMGKT